MPCYNNSVFNVNILDNIRPGNTNPETLSEEIKILKPLLLLKIINAHKMDQAMIFMRTKVDCDHLEDFFRSLGGNKKGIINHNEFGLFILILVL